ncbi:MAG: extracellular solute-binding protein [Cohaesibacter sp.]|nr:extracellular solute-binding protein [Cohaesibacter sp.]
MSSDTRLFRSFVFAHARKRQEKKKEALLFSHPLACMIGVCCVFLSVTSWALSVQAEPSHGISMHGSPKYKKDFSHLSYANPKASKGGKIAYAGQGSFDSLNPFLLKGVAPRGLWDVEYGHNVYEPLMIRAADEAFSLYGLLVEWADMPEDRSSITFKLRSEARFSDGHALDVDDVIFTVNLLKEYGRPAFQSRIKRIKDMVRLSDDQIRFVFHDGKDRELPLLIAALPVLPAHAIDPAKFAKSGLNHFIGSGPYLIDKVEPGTRLVLKRNPDYWGKDLPVKRGMDNFDQISIEYFRDNTAMFEAFKKGAFDMLPESDPARWANQYDFPAAIAGKVLQKTFQSRLPKGMSGFAFNTRRAVFADRRVRRALASLFDFHWVNKNLYHGLFRRTGSYFQNSDLSALTLKASDMELALLSPFKDSFDKAILNGTYRPVSAKDGRDMRKVMGAALKALRDAGYSLVDGVMKSSHTGRPLTFEFLATTKEQERLALAYSRILERLGIVMRIRTIDSAQYWERRKTMDFDMIKMSWSASLSPGNEQFSRWHSSQRDKDGWFNQAGAQDPAIDAMIDALLAAKSSKDFTAAVRAFDRALINGYYVVPLFHKAESWLGIWSHIGIPDGQPLGGYLSSSWWDQRAR